MMEEKRRGRARRSHPRRATRRVGGISGLTRRTKVVVRGGVSREQLCDKVASLPVVEFWFSDTAAFLTFKDESTALQCCQLLDGQRFNQQQPSADSKEGELQEDESEPAEEESVQCTVDLAVNRRTGKGTVEDSLSGTLAKDVEFLSFIETLNRKPDRLASAEAQLETHQADKDEKREQVSELLKFLLESKKRGRSRKTKTEKKGHKKSAGKNEKKAKASRKKKGLKPNKVDKEGESNTAAVADGKKHRRRGGRRGGKGKKPAEESGEKPIKKKGQGKGRGKPRRKTENGKGGANNSSAKANSMADKPATA